jgi:transposase InsO family protein
MNTVEKVVRKSDSCQRVQYVRQKPQGDLHPLQITDRRWESVLLDLITDLPITKKGHDAVVVFVDQLSKMVHVAACTKTVTAEQLAELLEQEVFKHHGIPKDIVSDRDVRFQSDFWKSFNDKLGIKLNMSTAKHPQTDGQTERANGILEDTLRHLCRTVPDQLG